MSLNFLTVRQGPSPVQAHRLDLGKGHTVGLIYLLV